MKKLAVPLILALAVVLAILFHILLPLQNGIHINTVDAYYMLRYADIWPNLPATDFFFNYPTGTTPMPTMFWPALIALVSDIFSMPVTTAGAWLPPVLFLLTLIPVYIITKELFGSNIMASVSVLILAMMPGEVLHRTMLGAADCHCLEIFLVAMIMMFSLLALKKWIYWMGAFAFAVLYFFSWRGAPIILPMIALFLIILFYKRWQMWLATAFVSAGIYFIFPKIIKSGLDILILNIHSTVSETMPLFFTSGHFDATNMIANFGITLILSLFGAGILLRKYIKSKDKGTLLFLVWFAVMFALTFSMRRFAYYFAVNIAMATSFAIFYLVQKIRFSKAGLYKYAAVLGIAIPLLFLQRSFVTATSDFGTMPIAWQEAASWLRVQNTTTCEKGYFTGEDLGYAVLSQWNYGYWIAREAHMPVSFTPGNWRGNDILRKTDISEDIKKNHWRYIVLCEEMFTTNKNVIFKGNSTMTQSAVYNIFYSGKPIWQSEDGTVKIFEESK